MEEAVLSPVKEEYVKSYREEEKALMVCGGGNKAGRFLEAVVYDVGGRKGIIWILEGRNGQGWR